MLFLCGSPIPPLDMFKQDLDKLKKAADMVLVATGEVGYYAEVEDTPPDATIRLRTVEGYFHRPPSPDQVKPVAQELRAGLARRGYQVKGIKPARIKDGILYMFVVRNPEPK